MKKELIKTAVITATAAASIAATTATTFAEETNEQATGTQEALDTATAVKANADAEKATAEANATSAANTVTETENSIKQAEEDAHKAVADMKASAEADAKAAEEAAKNQPTVIENTKQAEEDAKVVSENAKATVETKTAEVEAANAEKPSEEQINTATSNVDTAKANKDSAQGAVAEANNALNDAKAALEEKTDDVTTKENAKNSANTDLENANAKLNSDKGVTAEKENDLRKALEKNGGKDVLETDEYKAMLDAEKESAKAHEKVEEKKTAEAEAKKDADAKESILNDKKNAEAEKKNALDTENTNVSTKESIVSEKEGQKNGASASVDTAKNNVENAKSDVNAKETEKNKALEKQAKERQDYETNRAATEAAKREKLKDDVATADAEKNAISQKIANASEQVKKGFEGFLDWAKTKFKGDTNTIKDIERAVDALHQYPAGMIVGDENDATSLRNVKEALKVLVKYNEQRVHDEHFTGLDPLGTTFYMMATAISNADNSANPANGHTRHFNMGENLAWGYADPNKGWYEEEKVVWEALQEFTAKYLAEHPGVNITKRGPEKTAFENAWTNYAKNEKKFFNIQTGHYTNAVNRNYIMTGIGRSTVANKRGKMVYDQQLQKFVEVGGEKKYTEDQLDSYGITFSQTFSTSTEGNGPETEKIYTIAEFTSLFDEYMDTVDTTKLNAKLDEATKKYNDAVTARDAYKGEPALGEREGIRCSRTEVG